MKDAFVYAFLATSGVLLVAFLGFGAGRWYVRLIVPLVAVGAIVLAGFAVEPLSEAQCSEVLSVVGQGGTPGRWFSFYCLELFLGLAAVVIALFDLACLMGLLLRPTADRSHARGDG